MAGSEALAFLLYTRTTRVALAALKTYPPIAKSGNVTRTYLQADFRVSADDPSFDGIQTTAMLMLAFYTLVAPLAAFAALDRAGAGRGAGAAALHRLQRNSSASEKRAALLGAGDAAADGASVQAEAWSHPLAMLSNE